MDKILAESFVERVKSESKLHKFLKIDFIYQLINFFQMDYMRQQYPSNIKNTLEMALCFYKYYNNRYYNMIIKSINEGRIIISNDNVKSYVENNNAFIRLFGNDSDLFILVHEFAHFIDRNLNPTIIPNEYQCLGEVFPFYMEKQFELWLNDKEYSDFIEIRRNNRMYFESRMLDAILYQLSCELSYKETGVISLGELDIVKVKSVMSYDYDLNIGLVNYLLRYPLANILSEYLISRKEIIRDTDIYIICLNTNLYEVLEDFKKNKIFYK